MRAQVIENVSPLGSNGAYTSGTRDMQLVADDFGMSYSFFVVEVDSDEGGTVEIDQSTDLIVWAEVTAPSSYTAASGILSIGVQPTEQYVRAKFTNGATAQGRFTMTTGVDQVA